MNVIQPRYEYRAWARDLGHVVGRIEALSKAAPVRMSEEIYLIPAVQGINPKIRDDQIDVKVLIEVREGFERWEPRLKMSFPMRPAPERTALFEILDAPNPPAGNLTLEGFLDLVEQTACVRTARLVKERRAYAVAGCITEVASVTIEGTRLETAAVESADLDAAIEARRLTGLSDYPNVNYPTIIRRTIAG